MAIPAAAPLEEFLEHLNLKSVDDETEVQRILVAATGAAEGIAGPIVHREVTSRLTVSGGAGLLPVSPVSAVATLTGLQGAPSWVSGQLDVDEETGIVSGASGRLTDGSYTAAYTAGRWAAADEVSEDVRLAVCIIGKHLWETQRGRGNSRGGALGTAQAPDEKVPSGFLVPHRARSLLADYEQLPVA